MIAALIPHVLAAVGDSTFLTALAIIVSAFTVEDATSVIVGILVADGHISVGLGLGALYAGILCSDMTMYGLGRLARTHPRLARFAEHDAAAPLRGWLEAHFVPTVFAARFFPGMRFATYSSSGFFRGPAKQFFPTVIVATLAWVTMLFFLFVWFGTATSKVLGWGRYGIAIAFFVVLFLVGRHIVKRALRSDRSTEDESRAD